MYEWVTEDDVENVLAKHNECVTLGFYIEDLEAILADTLTSDMHAYMKDRIELSKEMYLERVRDIDTVLNKFANMETDILRITSILEAPKKCLPSELTKIEISESAAMREQLDRIQRILSIS